MKISFLHIINFLFFHRTLFICTCLFLSGIFIYPINPAHGISITPVKHLFTLSQDFSQPSDVAVSENGRIYVVDGVNNKIKVFNSSGVFQSSFGQKGSSNGHFHFPLGIAVDNKDRIYIADSGNNRVQIFSPTGAFIAKITLPNDGNSHFRPLGPRPVKRIGELSLWRNGGFDGLENGCAPRDRSAFALP
ncbi:MAG: NHL repeat-containing protein, partial [Nitrospiraceae bacterium]